MAIQKWDIGLTRKSLAKGWGPLHMRLNMCAPLAYLERFSITFELSVYVLSTARVPAPKGLQSLERKSYSKSIQQK